jgi:hypothetical protein
MTVIAALLLFLGLLTFICITPLDLCFRAEQTDTFSLDVRATWLFGLVEKTFRTGGGPGKRSSGDHRTSGPGEGEPESTEGRRRRRKSGPPREKPSGKGGRKRALLAALGTSGFSARLFRFVGDLLRAVLPRDVSVRLEGGLEDPASTGMACAAVAAFSPGLRCIPQLRLEWHPDFDRHDLTGEAEAEFRLVPARIMWPAARFVCHPTTIRALRAAAREKRR